MTYELTSYSTSISGKILVVEFLFRKKSPGKVTYYQESINIGIGIWNWTLEFKYIKY